MRFFLMASFVICTCTANAQNFWVDLFAGATNYQGDLQDKRYTFNQANFAGGGGITYDISDHFSTRLHLLFGKISAHDKFGKNQERNLSFASGIFEAQAALQFYLWPLNSRSVTPYAFAGLGLFHFNPYTLDSTGSKYFLKPLSTEGQGFVDGRNAYSLTQLSIPFGGGLKLSLTDDLNVGLELGLRKTFTDYLDDVSKNYVDGSLLLAERGAKAVELAYRGGELKGGNPVYPDPESPRRLRGNPKSLDWYYFTALTFSFRLSEGNFIMGGSKTRSSRQLDCPTL